MWMICYGYSSSISHSSSLLLFPLHSQDVLIALRYPVDSSSQHKLIVSHLYGNNLWFGNINDSTLWSRSLSLVHWTGHITVNRVSRGRNGDIAADLLNQTEKETHCQQKWVIHRPKKYEDRCCMIPLLDLHCDAIRRMLLKDHIELVTLAEAVDRTFQRS